MRFFRAFLESIFPERCVGCSARGTLLCDVCAKKLPGAMAPEHDFITSIWSFRDGRIKRLIWLMKYKNARHVADICAPYLSASLTEFIGEETPFLGPRIFLVPIPLSKKRMRERGYNQAERLAESTAKLLPEGKCAVISMLLKKDFETPPQAKVKKRSDRLKNLGECFSVHLPTDGIPAKGDTLILIDDVTTTGATLITARRALKRAGFKKVFALTIAH